MRYTVSPDYFQTMGIELIKGRLFTAEDTRDSPPVIVIDEVLARQYFPNEDPLGKRLKQSARLAGFRDCGRRPARRTLQPGRTRARPGPVLHQLQSDFLAGGCQAMSGASIC